MELKAALHDARKRYRKAELTVARMKAQTGELYRKTYEIERLRAAAKECKRQNYESGLPAKLTAKLHESGRVNQQLNGRLRQARQRIEKLEAENERLRSPPQGETNAHPQK